MYYFSFYHYLRASGANFPQKTEPAANARPANPDAVDSQKEADEIAIAIQRSLQEEEQKKKSTVKVQERLAKGDLLSG